MFDEAAEIDERIVEMRSLAARAHLVAGIYHVRYSLDLVRARLLAGRWSCVRAAP